MHTYLRAVGFSRVKNSKDMHEVIMNILENADHRDYITGTTASKPIKNKIYVEEDGQTKINYILEGETEDEDTIQ